MDPRERLRRAKPLEFPLEVCLDGELVAQHHELQRAHERANVAPRERMTDGAEAARIAEQLRALEAELRAATVNVRMRSLGKDGWNLLVEEHQARPGEELDEKWGFNADTLFDVLVERSMYSMVPLDEPDAEPTILTDDDRQMLLAVMTRDKFDEAAGIGLSLNIRKVSIPFSSAASKQTQPSASE